jgi:hypothetical protein
VTFYTLIACIPFTNSTRAQTLFPTLIIYSHYRMHLANHAKASKKVYQSLARRNLDKEANVFKECALFCEFLEKLKESISQPICEAEYTRLLKKHIKATLSICKRHSDVPACSDYITKTHMSGGGFLDWFKPKQNPSSSPQQSDNTSATQPPSAQPPAPASAPAPIVPVIPQAPIVPQPPRPEPVYNTEERNLDFMNDDAVLTDEQRALKERYISIYEDFARRAMERGLDPQKLLKERDQIGGKKKSSQKNKKKN